LTVNGKKVQKASFDISDSDIVEVAQPLHYEYVSRGGYKLEAALSAFGIDPCDQKCLDIGASSGGFTDCLLSRGAAKVYAVDAGVGQLAPRLASDPRVCSIERCNARELELQTVGGERFDLIVMDVSFISATYIMPRFPALLDDGGHAVVLIKPQFEVGKASVGKGGIVRDVRAHREAVERVLHAGIGLGLCPVGLIVSPVTGGDGNREFLVDFIRMSGAHGSVTAEDIRRVTGARAPDRKE